MILILESGILKRLCVSKTSKTLLISVALSIETFGPIFQVGWARACSGVMFSSSFVVLPKNGPPEQVIVTEDTFSGPCSYMSCQIADASESSGKILPLRYLPAIASDSLFAARRVLFWARVSTEI